MSHDPSAISDARIEPKYIVGVGASAGGLEALEKLFSSMPSNTGMAFVVVQHLSPDYKSLTDELLARKTHIPIHQAANDMLVEPDNIYLLPPRKEMILSNGRLLLTDKDPTQLLTLPIDGFLRSLAGDAGARSVAVILSGTGSDGSRGVRDIHEAGGLVIVQTSETAKFDGMPRSAVQTGAVDIQIPPEEIASALSRYSQGLMGADLVAPPSLPPSIPGMNDILEVLRQRSGLDFSPYKPETVVRRIERRLGLQRCESLEQYAADLAADPDEVDRLYRDLLIGVTGFFRDPQAFASLRATISSSLAKVSDGDELRVWISGCATGEEAYSIGILLDEEIQHQKRNIQAKIFATDVHQNSLSIASAGMYQAAQLASLTPEQIARYFQPRGNEFQVTPDLRKLVVFARHNVLKDAPFTKIDLIVCRNLLIYFRVPSQKKVLSLFHFGLRAQGILFLGPSEGPGELADEFDCLDQRWKIYRKRRDIRLSPEPRIVMPASMSAIGLSGLTARSRNLNSEGTMQSVVDAIVDSAMPMSFLVNERMEVLRTFGGSHRYLRVAGGWFSNELLELVEPEMRLALAGAIPKAIREMKLVRFNGLQVGGPSSDLRVDLTVEPIQPTQDGSKFALVKITERHQMLPPTISDQEIALAEISREQILSLEGELQSTRENLQAMVEELETSNEELQATNEELIASNEELQSTNEELHSVNEELYTVNVEYQRKIDELTVITSDMDNLLNSTEVHTIFLDQDLAIRRFTPRMAETFHLEPRDVGRKIHAFAHEIQYSRLLEDLTQTLQTGESVERQVQTKANHWYLLRILPYRAAGKMTGVVLTLIDIDRVKSVEAESRRKDEQLASILRNSPNWIFIKDLEGRYVLADQAFANLVGIDPIGRTAFDLFPSDVAAKLTEQDKEVMLTRREVQRELVIPHPDGDHVYLSIMFPIQDELGQMVSLGGIRTDITEIKRAESQAKEAVIQRDRFLAMLSHELRNPLAAVTNALEMMELGESTKENPQDWLSMIRRRCRHMSRLLDDLLDVSRIAQNKIHIKRRVIDLHATLPEILDEIRAWTTTRRQNLIVEVPQDPVWVEGDLHRLQQIQVNLLLNASKYTPEEGTIWLKHQQIGSNIEIVVQDSGIGIAPEVLPKIFELFVQASETLDRSSGGIGVGLTLVRSLVELHGGSVHASSPGIGLGSTFTVRLPASSIVPEVPALPSVPTRSMRREGLSLVIVEDDPDIRHSLASLLRMSGHQVRDFATADEALVSIHEQCPEVAILDVGLPGIDGYELARRIRSSFSKKRLGLIAVTGYGRDSDRENAREAGFDAHVTKPILDIDDLLLVIDETIQSMESSPA
jgi:two-component system CheB/CheR fusion protein